MIIYKKIDVIYGYIFSLNLFPPRTFAHLIVHFLMLDKLPVLLLSADTFGVDVEGWRDTRAGDVGRSESHPDEDFDK